MNTQTLIFFLVDVDSKKQRRRRLDLPRKKHKVLCCFFVVCFSHDHWETGLLHHTFPSFLEVANVFQLIVKWFKYFLMKEEQSFPPSLLPPPN